MHLTELTPIPAEILPIDEFRAHLRLGTGFSDDDVQDVLLERTLRAAISQVEGICSKSLISRDFCWIVHAWRDLGRQTLPRAPVHLVKELAIVDLENQKQVISAERFSVHRDSHCPALVTRGFTLPQIPVGGSAQVTFEAGFGNSWDNVPADLALATISLAAAHYEHRIELGDVTPGVQAMLAPYRQHRLLGGF